MLNYDVIQLPLFLQNSLYSNDLLCLITTTNTLQSHLQREVTFIHTHNYNYLECVIQPRSFTNLLIHLSSILTSLLPFVIPSSLINEISLTETNSSMVLFFFRNIFQIKKHPSFLFFKLKIRNYVNILTINMICILTMCTLVITLLRCLLKVLIIVDYTDFNSWQKVKVIMIVFPLWILNN